MAKDKSSEKQIEPQSHALPPHLLKSIEKGMKQIANGQKISLEEFKERHFSKKSVS